MDNTEAKKNEISKDVSSFANSDGGIIVYGTEESGHIPIRIDGVVVTPRKREWLEQVINSRFQPKIDGLRIKQIDLTSQPGRAVFVIQIPIGFTAHQAHDFRYYRRYNFQSVPMHDYEVKMVMNRFREPVIELGASTNHGEKVSLPIDGELQHWPNRWKKIDLIEAIESTCDRAGEDWGHLIRKGIKNFLFGQVPEK